jgi:hypothetical protein
MKSMLVLGAVVLNVPRDMNGRVAKVATLRDVPPLSVGNTSLELIRYSSKRRLKPGCHGVRCIVQALSPASSYFGGVPLSKLTVSRIVRIDLEALL